MVEKVFAAVLIKVVLLGGAGGPQVAGQATGPRLPSTTTFESTVTFGWSQLTYSLAPAQTLEGEKVVQEPAAGLTVVMGPDEERLQALFGEVERDESNYQEATVEAEAGEVRGGRAAWIWPERQFEFARPESRRAYYLEQVEEDLYRRVPLPETQGHVVTVRLDSSPNTYDAEVEFCGRRLHGGEYDEAIRAFVGRPVVSKSSVTAFVRFKLGQPVLLIWQGEPAVAEARAYMGAWTNESPTVPLGPYPGRSSMESPFTFMAAPMELGHTTFVPGPGVSAVVGQPPEASLPVSLEPSAMFAPRRFAAPMGPAPATVTPGVEAGAAPRQTPASGIAVLLQVKEQAAAED